MTIDDELGDLVLVCRRPARAVDGVSTEDRLEALLEATAETDRNEGVQNGRPMLKEHPLHDETRDPA